MDYTYFHLQNQARENADESRVWLLFSFLPSVSASRANAPRGDALLQEKERRMRKRRQQEELAQQQQQLQLQEPFYVRANASTYPSSVEIKASPKDEVSSLSSGDRPNVTILAPISICLGAMFCYIIAGAFTLHKLEGWTFIGSHLSLSLFFSFSLRLFTCRVRLCPQFTDN